MFSAATGVQALPKVTSATPLAGGDDDRASVNATAVVAALGAFGIDLGPGAVAAPGYTADQVGAGIVTHCVANYRIGILSGPLGALQADMAALVAGIQSSSPLHGDYVGLFGPWVLIPDGSTTRAIDPVSYVAGVRARAINADGFQKAPAGTISNAQFVLGIATPLDATGNNAWNDAQINGITVYRGTTRLYGWRSLSKDPVNFSDLTPRSIANAVQDLVQQACDPFVFDTIDGSGLLYAQLAGAITGYLQPAADNNAFFPLFDADGNQLDPGYKVTVNPALADLQQGANTVLVTVGFRPAPTADLILVDIVIAGLGVAL
jgi:phage tail sheath protein FI